MPQFVAIPLTLLPFILNGTPIIDAGSVGAAGGVGLVGHAAIGPPPNSYTQNDRQTVTRSVWRDYAKGFRPTGTPAGSCNSGICTPGIYSSGIQLKGGSWTLQPGIYWIEGGKLQTGPGGGGTTVVTGSGGIGGVTLVFTSTSTGINIDSKSDVTLTAPTFRINARFCIDGRY